MPKQIPFLGRIKSTFLSKSIDLLSIFFQLAIQSLNDFIIHFNDMLKGVLFLAVKLYPALFKLGGIGLMMHKFHKVAERKY